MTTCPGLSPPATRLNPGTLPIPEPDGCGRGVPTVFANILSPTIRLRVPAAPAWAPAGANNRIKLRVKCSPMTKGGKVCCDEGRAMRSGVLRLAAADRLFGSPNFVAARRKGIDNHLRNSGKPGNITRKRLSSFLES